MFHKKQKSCFKGIDLVSAGGLYQWKSFYKVKNCFMANLSVINILPNRIANIYVNLKNITSQLHNMSESIGFIEKALFFDRVPNLQMLKDNSSKKQIVLQIHKN